MSHIPAQFITYYFKALYESSNILSSFHLKINGNIFNFRYHYQLIYIQVFSYKMVKVVNVKL